MRPCPADVRECGMLEGRGYGWNIEQKKGEGDVFASQTATDRGASGTMTHATSLLS